MKLKGPAMRSSLLLAFVFAVSSALPAALQAADSKAVSIDFSRPIKPGAEFDCEIMTEHSRKYTLTMAGVDAPAVRTETASAVLCGRMRVSEVNEAGNTLKMEFTPSVLSGKIDGKELSFPELAGKTVCADLSKLPCVFELKDQTAGKLPPQAAALLATAFRQSSKSGLKELMDPGRPVTLGESWTPPFKLLLESLAQRGMKLEASDLEGGVTLKGKDAINGIECWTLEEKIQTKTLQGFDFRLAISIFLPCDPAKGGPVRISRTGAEILAKSMPEDNPLSAGKSIEAVVKDRMEATLLPVAPASTAR